MRKTLSAGLLAIYSSATLAAPVTAVSSIPGGEVGMLALLVLSLAGGIWLAKRKQQQ